MRVVRLIISNFRGIKAAELHFDGHTLLVGSNNVGKSTVCEALDLALGPDRLNRFPAIDEFDFYNSVYLLPPTEANSTRTPTPLRVEALLIELSLEVEAKCGGNLEFWHLSERRLLGKGEVAAANPPDVIPCLRIETIGQYDPDDDEFDTKTFFSSSPDAAEGELTQVPRHVKRQFGFLYLRTLRTGSRALSLQRGSLLDIILRTKGVRTTLWESTIDQLRTLDIEAHAGELAPVLREVEQKLARYVALQAPGNATRLHVSDLTRENLRETLSFFLALSPDQSHVPFSHAGTGTINTLVLALLSFIADLKPETVIFAMEEPEIAVPPHTQRRIADYLLTKTTQAFVTSHSPYVIERFEPSQTLLLVRDNGVVSAKKVSEATGLKDNEFKRFARAGLAEAMLGKAVIVVEGVTEFHALPVAAQRMAQVDPALQELDVAGVAFLNGDGVQNMAKLGRFFTSLGLDAFAFYDKNKKLSETHKNEIHERYKVDFAHAHTGFEGLVSQEMPANTLWAFLSELKANEESGEVGIPATRPSDDEVRSIAKMALGSNKSAGWVARLFQQCSIEELPVSITTFLSKVFAYFPLPTTSATSSGGPGTLGGDTSSGTSNGAAATENLDSPAGNQDGGAPASA